MIRYTLICENGHEYEAWFQNAGAYDKQVKAKQLECAICGTKNVKKALMRPNIPAKQNTVSVKPQEKADLKPTSPKEQEVQKALRTIRKKIEENADYVGDKFAQEARKLYYQDHEDSRGIYGKATTTEMKELSEEGIPFLPVPNLPEEQN